MNVLSHIRLIGVSLAVLWSAVLSAEAGGGPQNVLLVVNDNSLESLELGNYYRQKRQIPDVNICHISTVTNYSMDTITFSNEVWGPITNYIRTAHLTDQIDYIIFSRGVPYRIYYGNYGSNRHAGITATAFYGFRSSPDAFVYGCNLATDSASEYFDSEHAFTHSGAPSSNRYYLSTVLNGWTFSSAKSAIDRSTASDLANPTGTVFLARSTDNDRNIQWYQYEDIAFSCRVMGSPQQCALVDTNAIRYQTNIIGYAIGVTWVSYLDQNSFLPGALAHHLTSYGGYLLDPSGSQMTILNWLNWGPVGSYGTVVEPCAYTNKFPLARLHYWYARGFNLAECFFMAVQNPYQGVVVGDPLCSPYAIPPDMIISGIQPNQIISNAVNVTVEGVGISDNNPVGQIDLFLDDLFVRTLTNVSLAPGNLLDLTVNSVTCSYVIASGDTLYLAASGLANAVNTSHFAVKAYPHGDRIELVYTNYGQEGGSIAYAASSRQGTASVLSVAGYVTGTNLLETTYPARKFITLSGTANSGDVVACTIMLTNGIVATNQITANAGQSCTNILDELMGVINSNENLQGSDGVKALYHERRNGYEQASLQARQAGPAGFLIEVNYQVTRAHPGSGLDTGVSFISKFDDNADVLTARGMVFVTGGYTNLSTSFDLVATNLADGPHILTVVGYEGSAVRVQGRTSIPFIVDRNTAICEITNPETASTFLLGESITAHVYAAASVPVTSLAFYVEGKVFAVTGAPPYVFVLNTTNYGVGVVGLQARAVATNGDVVISSNVTVTILPDYDFDGLDDDWEIRNFKSITNYNGSDDPDLDGADNRNEYMADTQPTNSASFFTLSRIAWSNGMAQLEFTSSTARQYRLHYNDDSLLEGLWSESSNWLWGGAGITTQIDDGTAMPLPTNLFRFYRVRAQRP